MNPLTKFASALPLPQRPHLASTRTPMLALILCVYIPTHGLGLAASSPQVWDPQNWMAGGREKGGEIVGGEGITVVEL